MELEHSFTVPVPAEQAWQALLDVEQVAPCMPGASVESVEGDVINGRIKVKVGPVMLTYTGTARFTERDEQAHVVTMEASGRETRGGGTASATVRSSLRDEGGLTRVVVNTTLSVTGRPAQFGRGMLAEVGGKIIERFASNLAAQLTGGRAEAEPERAGAAPEAAASGAAPTAAAGGAPAPAPAAAAAPVPEAPASAREALRGLPIDDLQLPARPYNSLRREGVLTIGDLCDRTEAQLRAIDHVGPQAIREIREKLAARGLSLTEPAAVPEAVAGAEAAAGVEAVAGAEAAAGVEAAAVAGAAAPEAAGAPQAAAGAAGPGPAAAAPRAPRPPDEEAIDLLSVAGFPVLKRVLPVVGGGLALLLIYLRMRRRRRRRITPG